MKMKNYFFATVLSSAILCLCIFSINANAQNKHQMPSALKFDKPSVNTNTQQVWPSLKKEKGVNNPVRKSTTENKKQTQVIKYDSIYKWIWNTGTLNWKYNSKTVDIFYNPANKITSQIEWSWNGLTFEKNIKTTSMYINDTLLSYYLEQEWNGTSWDSSFRVIRAYDTNNYPTLYMEQSWNGTGWNNDYKTKIISTFDPINHTGTQIDQNGSGTSWINYRYYSFTVDSNNVNGLSDYIQEWNGSAWVNKWAYIFAYDSNSNMTIELDQVWSVSHWVDEMKKSYTYDLNNNNTIELYQIWTGTAWEDSYKRSCSYNTNNKITHLYDMHWNVSIWDTNYKEDYTYDLNGDNTEIYAYGFTTGYHLDTVNRILSIYDNYHNQIYMMYQDWVSGSWINYVDGFNTYIPNNLLEALSVRYWDNAGIAINGGDSTKYFIHTTGIDDLAAVDENINVYPNPCKGKFTVNSSNQINSIEVFNIYGEPVWSDFNFGSKADLSTKLISKEIDLTGRAKGIYFLVLRDGEKIHTGKIVIQ